MFIVLNHGGGDTPFLKCAVLSSQFVLSDCHLVLEILVFFVLTLFKNEYSFILRSHYASERERGGGRAKEGFPVSAAEGYLFAAVMCVVEFEEISH